VPVVLSEEQRKQLERWLSALGTPQQVALRCRIILSCAAGKTEVEAAAENQVNRNTVRLWRERFNTQGLQALWQIAPGRGRKTAPAAPRAHASRESIRRESLVSSLTKKASVAGASFNRGRSAFFRATGIALPIASRTIRRCTLSFFATPAIVPTPNSYSLRISSNSSTFAPQFNESPDSARSLNQSIRCVTKVGQNKLPNWTSSDYRNHFCRTSATQPTLVRCAAKNVGYVFSVVDPTRLTKGGVQSQLLVWIVFSGS
jgi:transposase-like protein